MNLEVGSSMVESPDKNTAQLTHRLWLCETLSKGSPTKSSAQTLDLQKL